jgi:quinol monooxygenase YgiN
MFARVLEFTPKFDKKDDFVKVIRKEILPIMKNQPGFLEFLPFVPEVKNEKWITISLWTEKRHAENYVKDVFPKVEEILRPYLATPIVYKPHYVETILCEHFVEALTAA